jgi:hypothetical protein
VPTCLLLSRRLCYRIAPICHIRIIIGGLSLPIQPAATSQCQAPEVALLTTTEVHAAVATRRFTALRTYRTYPGAIVGHHSLTPLLTCYHRGYTTPVFSGKDEQRKKVEVTVTAKGFVPKELVKMEVDWFYKSVAIYRTDALHILMILFGTRNLGIDDTYFAHSTSDIIADHILALFGAKLLAYTKHDPEQLVIDLEQFTKPGEGVEGAVFIHTSPPGITSTTGPGATCERRWDIYSEFHYGSLIFRF